MDIKQIKELQEEILKMCPMIGGGYDISNYTVLAVCHLIAEQRKTNELLDLISFRLNDLIHRFTVEQKEVNKSLTLCCSRLERLIHK